MNVKYLQNFFNGAKRSQKRNTKASAVQALLTGVTKIQAPRNLPCLQWLAHRTQSQHSLHYSTTWAFPSISIKVELTMRSLFLLSCQQRININYLCIYNSLSSFSLSHSSILLTAPKIFLHASRFNRERSFVLISFFQVQNQRSPSVFYPKRITKDQSFHKPLRNQLLQTNVETNRNPIDERDLRRRRWSKRNKRPL